MFSTYTCMSHLWVASDSIMFPQTPSPHYIWAASPGTGAIRFFFFFFLWSRQNQGTKLHNAGEKLWHPGETRNCMTKRRQDRSNGEHHYFFFFASSVKSTGCIFRFSTCPENVWFHVIHLSWTSFIGSATHLNILLHLVSQQSSCSHLFFLFGCAAVFFLFYRHFTKPAFSVKTQCLFLIYFQIFTVKKGNRNPPVTSPPGPYSFQLWMRFLSDVLYGWTRCLLLVPLLLMGSHQD